MRHPSHRALSALHRRWLSRWTRPVLDDLRATISHRADAEDTPEQGRLRVWLARAWSRVPSTDGLVEQVRAMGATAARVTSAEARRALARAGYTPPQGDVDGERSPTRSDIDVFAQRDVGYLRKLVGRTLLALEALLSEPPADLVAAVAAEMARAHRHADLIADAEIGRLHGELVAWYQTRAGVDTYTWITRGDHRVRPLHRTLDGTTQRWSDPPVCGPGVQRGHPGMAPRCRCFASPRPR